MYLLSKSNITQSGPANLHSVKPCGVSVADRVTPECISTTDGGLSLALSMAIHIVVAVVISRRRSLEIMSRRSTDTCTLKAATKFTGLMFRVTSRERSSKSSRSIKSIRRLIELMVLLVNLLLGSLLYRRLPTYIKTGGKVLFFAVDSSVDPTSEWVEFEFAAAAKSSAA